ncbi:C10 family peptidase [Capnocytophaga sp. ARDL2]|uniref:C10 family peptidase n=1 Tax=Capnocytophaga sp. ARDL2 TaxID=3238809 RepID=UPI0035580863
MKRVYHLLLGGSILLSLFATSCSSEFKDNEITKNAHEKTNNRISIQQAKKVTVDFIKKTSKTKGKGIPAITQDNLEDVQTLVNDNNLPVLYVLNIKENKGFVVMSASTLERPILAYSDTGRFDLNNANEFDGITDWLFNKYLKIESLESKGKPYNNEISNQWASMGLYANEVVIFDRDGNIVPWVPPVLIDETTNTYGPLLGDIKWGQSYTTTYVMYNNTVRYNNCPAGTAPAGCVATAMGQIMKYHNHPDIFNISTMYPYVTIGSPYYYDSVPAQNIANFLGHIGNSVQMNYSCDRSGAPSQNARNAFNTVYNYSTSDLQPINLNILKTDILNGKPVYLDGYQEKEVIVIKKPIRLLFGMSIGKTKTEIIYKEGHAWVADGYEEVIGTYQFPDTNNTFTAKIADHIHMNWGGEDILTVGMTLIAGKILILPKLQYQLNLYITKE